MARVKVTGVKRPRRPSTEAELLLNKLLFDPLTLEDVREKLESAPTGAIVDNYHPLHSVCCNKTVTLEIVRFLLERDPDASGVRGPTYNLTDSLVYPIHLACKNSHCPSTVIDLLAKRYPPALSQVCTLRGYVGDFACHIRGTLLNYYLSRKTNIHIDVVQKLVSAFPEAAKSVGNYEGELSCHPLHLCLLCEETDANLRDIIEFLIASNPFSLSLTDRKGRLPLHVACSNKMIGPAVIELLLTRFPESTRMRDSDRRYPLHTLCMNKGASVEIVRLVLNSHQEAVHGVDSCGNLPIHHAAGNQTSDCLKLLLESFNHSSICIINNMGRNPLHVICANKMVDPAVIQLLCTYLPQSTRMRDNEGQCPLHTLCENSERVSTEAVRLILNSFLEAVRQVDNEGDLPIHYAAETQTPACLKLLLESYPESIRIRTIETDDLNNRELPFYIACSYGFLDTVEYLHHMHECIHDNVHGFLPIHSAAHNNEKDREGIVSYLLKQDPAAASKPVERDEDIEDEEDDTYQGRLLLHLACEDSSLSVIKLLYNAHPDALSVKDNQSRLPVDIAADANDALKEARIKFLQAQTEYALKAKEHDAMTTPDDSGRLPLHWALYNRAPLGSVKLMIRGNTSAVRCVDDDGILPFHIACAFGTPDVVQYLVERFGRCLNVCDGRHNFPLHYACRQGNSDVVKYLLDEKTASVSARNADKKLPIHLFCESVENDMNNNEGGAVHTETIWRLLLACPETVMNW